MSENWSIIKEEVSTYRNYVEKLPEKAKEAAKYCFLLTKVEIDRLLALKGAGHPLDGVRIYLGGNLIEGHLVPTVHVVAVEKDGTQYNDYNVPTEMPAAAHAMAAVVPAAGGSSTADLPPCPVYCSKTNILQQD